MNHLVTFFEKSNNAAIENNNWKHFQPNWVPETPRYAASSYFPQAPG